MIRLIKRSQGAADAAVTLANVRTHLGLSAGQTGLDDAITAKLGAAQGAIENMVQLRCTSREVTARFRVSPGPRPTVVVLPDAPVTAIGSVTWKYNDADTNPDFDATALYSIRDEGGKLRLGSLFEHGDADTQAAPDVIEVVHTAGYATPPPELALAISQLVADWLSFAGSAEEMLAGKLEMDLPGDYRKTLAAAGYIEGGEGHGEAARRDKLDAGYTVSAVPPIA